MPNPWVNVHKSTAAMNYFFSNMTNTIIFMTLGDHRIHHTTAVPFSPHMNTNIGCLRRQNFTWEVAVTSVGENPRWVHFHRIFVYTCKQSNIMCSCCVWPHGNGLVGFYSLQKLFKSCFFFFFSQSIIWVRRC
jgi:hypothetical protein